MMGLAYMQPMTLFDTFGIVSGMTDGHVPTAYAFALIAILFTALSYGKLVRRYPSAGSAYTYAQKSISPTVGFMVGWSSLLDYLFAPMINILLAKIYFEALVPSIPSWMFPSRTSICRATASNACWTTSISTGRTPQSEYIQTKRRKNRLQ